MLPIIAVTGVCPDGWTANILSPSSCFYYIPLEATFDDAKRACQLVGGDLVAPKAYIDMAGISNYMYVLWQILSWGMSRGNC